MAGLLSAMKDLVFELVGGLFVVAAFTAVIAAVIGVAALVIWLPHTWWILGAAAVLLYAMSLGQDL